MDTDWVTLWHDLVLNNSKTKPIGFNSAYEGRPDELLDFALKTIGRVKSVLEIGSGTGRWTIPLAKIADRVTAVEPSEFMLEKLKINTAAAGTNNIDILPANWQDAEVEPHDMVICAHGLYSSADLPAFVRKMEKCAIQNCFLEIRLPPVDGIIGELNRIINSSQYDSPNAIIAFNVLYSMGIYPDVKIESNIDHWTDTSIDLALKRARHYLHLEHTTEFDVMIRDTLIRRLMFSNNLFNWPDGMRSALFWWKTRNHGPVENDIC